MPRHAVVYAVAEPVPPGQGGEICRGTDVIETLVTGESKLTDVVGESGEGLEEDELGLPWALQKLQAANSYTIGANGTACNIVRNDATSCKAYKSYKGKLVLLSLDFFGG